ncbi:MAG: VWA domain-containing protein [Candidatus Dormibacteraeota bacterium]|nr:VWA domain-containing protein [Candidatus Dormibacteraeota bacterium]
MVPVSQRYSRWDGSQQEVLPDADEVFSRLAEDVFHGWDLDSALHRLLSQGFKDSHGRRLPGLDRMLAELKRQRQERLERHNLSHLFEGLEERLDHILARERTSLQERLDQAADTGSAGLMGPMVKERLRRLDALPPQPASAIQQLQNYEFLDQRAAMEFRQLVEELRRDLVDSHFREMGRNLGQMGPGEMTAVKEMVQDLNQMLERHLAGEETNFQRFMEKWGALWPDRPDTIDEFIERLQDRMAEMDSLMRSLSAEGRRELEDIFQAALGDREVQEALDRLGRLLGRLPQMGRTSSAYSFSGGGELDFPEALETISALGRLEEAERGLRQAYSGEAVPEELQELLAEFLGPQAAQSVAQVQELLAAMEEGGQLTRGEQGPALTAKGVRRIGQKALGDIFQHLGGDRLGNHGLGRPGSGVEAGDEVKDYEFGDPFRLDVQRTVMNAIRRGESQSPVHLERRDFAVVRSDRAVRSSTVLMLDMSRSMPLRGYFYAAKKMALALDSLIRTQYPRDSLYVVGFSDYAREIGQGQLAELTYSEYVYGTNMQHGLMLAQRLLNQHRGGNRQIIIVSDGEPTAHMEGSQAVFCYPPLPETFEKTLLEVRRCTRERIVINTFMLESNNFLVQFVKQITRLNRGRAFFVSPEHLGDYVLLDYVSSRGPAN